MESIIQMAFSYTNECIAIMPNKKCSACKKPFPATTEYFHRDRTEKDGLFLQCKVCRSKSTREYNSRPEVKKRVQDYGKTYRKRDEIKQRKHIQNRKQKYGLTQEEYLAMIEEHGGLCAMCGNPERLPGKSLSIDHDHVTGKVRGLLCFICNTRLAILENAEFMASAREYLTKYTA